ncbi:hypothetical protein [uncultured Roseibium sp.]|uniref:hypothetical protein n=1 Tax=uncultured Roseibium sp. TaxID=1936171 RepID=UPI00321714C1
MLRRTKVVCAAFAVSMLFLATAEAFSDNFETPPEQDPGMVLGNLASGPGYGVLTPVRSDGFLRVYDLKTQFGTEHVVGDGLLKLRIHEIAAYTALKSLESQQSFVDGLKEAAKKPAEFVESTVTDPLGTAKSTVSGVGRLFGRISKGVEKAVTGETTSPGELAAIVTGRDRARRELAVKLGVDPYTTYQPLSEQLDRAATASTAGNLSVGVIMSLIPGGMITNVASSAESLRDLIVDNTRSELEERTATVLRDLNISQRVIDDLAANANYTPTERAIIAYQLQAISTVEGLEILVARAADTKNREEAYFLLRRIVLTEHYSSTVASLSQIRKMADFPIAIRRDGGAALVMPLDMLSWTASTAKAFSGLQDGLSRLPFPPTGVDFQITGDITSDAAERLASFGWDVTADLPMPKGPVF